MLEYITDNANRTTCLIDKKHSVISNVYNGIAETLLLNVLGWIGLLLLFAILRKKAWNYGRLALVRSVDNAVWTQLFYGNNDDPDIITTDSNADSMLNIDRGICCWLPAVFKITKHQFLTRCGPDAVHYLSFQRHLLFIMAIVTSISTCIVLPINFQGNLSGNETSFGHTTVVNLDSDSPWLWSHIIIAMAYVPMFILIMRKCSGRVPPPKEATRTIMVSNISAADSNKTTIAEYIRQLFPDIEIMDVQMAYNVAKLTVLHDSWETAFKARVFCEAHNKRVKTNLTLREDWCSCERTDALEYYARQETKLRGELERQKAYALSKPLGIAFVTVYTSEAADHIVEYFQPGTYRVWMIEHAPTPSDIFWENLNTSTGFWYTKAILINCILFIILFFVTTPAIIVNMLDTLHMINNGTINNISPIVSEFLPTLILWTMSALLPVLVSYSDQWLSHWTRSQQNHAIMTKTFGFLLFMILILPSLGLTSAEALLEWSLQTKDRTYRWDCVFLPDKGAFFVNYVITSAFIGTSLELIRFPELAMYIWKLCMAKSIAETFSIRKSILREFPFGAHYAWTLMIFTTSVVYSLACPLITPFALIYLGLKHCGDRHNLYFAYGPSNMSSRGGGRIHATAVQLTRVSLVLLMISMAALSFIRTGGFNARVVVMLISLACTVGALFWLSPFPTCTSSTPQAIEGTEESIPVYIAPVLQNQIPFSDSTLQHFNYGSDSPDTPVDVSA
ncbi:CSC1-like protein 1 [Ctenocephalides felis]|uniref:CSC1-like protein 1 n=1 Tax=Ctenocephalides felis TaxID=7515 RepID=UPI000E6E1761|nr:CSC1-like protein 1 [Ctenocephalides felis]